MGAINPSIVIAITGVSSLAAVLTTVLILVREHRRVVADLTARSGERAALPAGRLVRERPSQPYERRVALPSRARRPAGGVMYPILTAVAIIVVAGSLIVGEHAVSRSRGTDHAVTPAVPQSTLTAPDSLAVSQVGFSSDGKLLAGVSNPGGIYLWNPARPQSAVGRIPPPGNGKFDSVAFSPVAHILADGTSDGSIQLWNIASPARPQMLSNVTSAEHEAASFLAFSADGKTLVSGGSVIRLWSVANPARPLENGSIAVDSGSAVTTTALSPDGKLAASASNGTIRLWNLDQRRATRYLAAMPSIDFTSLAFSPNGAVVAAGDLSGSTILWNVATGRVITALPDPGRSSGVSSVAFSPNGAVVAAGDLSGSTFLWNVATGRLITALPDPGGSSGISSVAFSPDGATVAAGDLNGSTFLWNAAAWYPVPSPRPQGLAGAPLTVKVSVPPDAVLAPSTQAVAISTIVAGLNARLDMLGRAHDRAALVLIFASSASSHAGPINGAIEAANTVFGHLRSRDPIFANSAEEGLWAGPPADGGYFEFQIFFQPTGLSW